MKMLKIVKIFFPKTFTFRILIILIIVSLIPLLTIGIIVNKAIKSNVLQLTTNQGKIIENQIIYMYQNSLIEKSYSINLQLKNVEKDVLNLQALASKIYSNPQDYPPLSKSLNLIAEKQGYYWENNLPNEPNIGIIGQKLISPQFINELSQSRFLNPILKEQVDNDPNISAMYYLHPDSAFYIYPALDVKEEVKEKFMNPNKMLTSYHFYQDALTLTQKQNKVAWTNPYIDITHRNRILSAISPVYDKIGKLRGVVGADVTIDTLVQNILDIKFKEPNAYAFLLGQNGELIAIQQNGYSDMSRIKFINLIKKGHTIINESDNSKDKFVLSTKISTTNWYLGYVIPRDEIHKPTFYTAVSIATSWGQKLLKEITVIFFLMVILCIIMTITVWFRVSKPFKLLITGFSKIAEGNFDNLKNSNIVEFNILIRRFNRMSSRIQDLMNSLIKMKDELEIKVEERTNELIVTNEMLKKSNNELLKVENWRKNLFSNISHDIKTPLTLIQGYIEAVLDGMIPPEETNNYLKNIDSRIKSINYLVKNLNDLSLLETGQIHANFCIISAFSLFQEIISKWKFTLETRGYFVMVECHEHLARIQVDYDLLERVINNLVENAMKYSSKGSLVSFIVNWKDTHVILSVKDQGKGIPDDTLPYIFERFYRVDKSRNTKVKGSGLGLSIAQEIIRIHQGQIWVEQNVDQGCTFSFSLPYAIDSSGINNSA